MNSSDQPQLGCQLSTLIIFFTSVIGEVAIYMSCSAYYLSYLMAALGCAVHKNFSTVQFAQTESLYGHGA